MRENFERCAECGSAITSVAYLGKVYCDRCIEKVIREHQAGDSPTATKGGTYRKQTE